MMGYAIGSRLAPNAIPVLRGDFERPDIVKLKTFFTTLATTSGAEMCLIVGVSPEARSYEDAMKGHEPVAEFDITDDMLDGYIKFLSCQESGPIDFMQIGCPHCTLEELNRFARYMKGKKVNPNVRAYIYTTISTLQMAEVGGIAKILRDAGIQLMTSGCVNTTLHLTDGAKGVALSAGKLTHYQRSELPDSRIYYGTDEQVLDAAVAGYWEVK